MAEEDYYSAMETILTEEYWQTLARPLDECVMFFDLVASAYVATHPGRKTLADMTQTVYEMCSRYDTAPNDLIAFPE